MSENLLQKVRTGGMSESGYGITTLETMKAEKLGDYTVLFVGPWTPEKIREVGEFCRREKKNFVMDEMVNRLTGEFTGSYEPISKEVLDVLSEYQDVLDGSLLMCEYGGLMFYWPQSTVAGSKTLPPPANDIAEAAANTEKQMREALDYAKRMGLKAPFFCIEASFFSLALSRFCKFAFCLICSSSNSKPKYISFTRLRTL